jgi:hypothetical protein
MHNARISDSDIRGLISPSGFLITITWCIRADKDKGWQLMVRLSSSKAEIERTPSTVGQRARHLDDLM